jgi:cytochrome c biogenesis protein ResB
MSLHINTLPWGFVVQKMWISRFLKLFSASQVTTLYNRLIDHPISLLLVSCLIFGLLGSCLLPFEHTTSGAVAGVILVLLLCFIYPPWWTAIVKILISRQFAMAELSVLAILIILGTLVIQNGSSDDYLIIYGEYLSQSIFYFGFHDIFQSPLFSTSLTLLWVALVILLYKRVLRLYKGILKVQKRQVGFILVHLAVIVILFGGFLSRVLGEKGVLPLYEGQTLALYESVNPGRTCHLSCKADDIEKHEGDQRRGLIKQLPFSLRLNEFQISRHQQTRRLYLYEFNHQKKSYSPITSWSLKLLTQGVSVSGKSIRLHKKESTNDDIYILEIEDKLNIERSKTVDVDSENPKPIMLDKMSTKALVFEATQKRVKEYLSKVTILIKGKEIGSYDITVNNPLSFAGYNIYQSSYDPNKPNFSVFQVVYDPGVPWIYVGFLFLFCGVVWTSFTTRLISKEIQ